MRSRAGRDPARTLVLLLLVASVLGPAPAPALDTDLSLEEMMALDPEELLEERVASASKRSESLFQASSAISLISAEDIRRSGATSLPDALRLIPGLDVARLSSGSWGISARGFTGQFSNKILVLIDGRSVYSPLQSGVFWEVQELLLEDVDRIEVIRGPGSTLWGSNAVNGVINIVTRDSRETQGALVSVAGGNEQHVVGGARWGGMVDDVGYRVWVRGHELDGALRKDGTDAEDDGRQIKGGFRIDGPLAGDSGWRLQGDIVDSRTGSLSNRVVDAETFRVERVVEDAEWVGWNLVAGYSRELDELGQLDLQAYWDGTDRVSNDLSERRDTWDVQLEYSLDWLEHHRTAVGFSYRRSSDRIRPGVAVAFDPSESDDDLVSGFLFHEIRLLDDRVQLAAGTKVESGDRTDDVAWQPTARVSVLAHPDHVIWGAVTRAIRLPSRFEQEVRAQQPPVDVLALPGGAVLQIAPELRGNSELEVEQLLATEVGYRTRAIPRVRLDVTAFYHRYEDLAGIGVGDLDPAAVASTLLDGIRTGILRPIVVPVETQNQVEADAWGVEVDVELDLIHWWLVHAAYTMTEVQATGPPTAPLDTGLPDVTAVYEGRYAEQLGQVRSLMDLPWDLELDLGAFFTDGRRDVGVPSHVRLDARLGWRPVEGLELSLVGQDLLEDDHLEYDVPLFVETTRVQRSVLGKVVWRFQP